MRKFILIYLFAACCLSLPLRAEEDDGVRAVYATTCEPLREGEAKASVRMRATDKASFKALENLSDLSDYRNRYDAHDYNVLVYTLVDNYLEDLAARTLQQDSSQICVEVTGYLNKSNIDQALQDLSAQQEAKYPDKLAVEPAAVTEPSTTALPPKPKLKISADIAVENMLAEEEETAPAPIPALAPAPELAQEAAPALATAPVQVADNRTKVFIERTKFFNDTSTNAFHTDLAQTLEENPLLTITNSLNNADYIVKTKVLRAKVDPINKQTSRLQMVVALELVKTENSSVMTEHQNRFILFESTENEQNVAASLLKKLLRKAGSQIAPKIRAYERAASAVITPTAPTGYKPRAE